MLIQLEKHIKKLDEYRAGTLKTGLRLGIPRLDEHFRFKYGDFNIILGHANVGKTSLVLYLMTLYAMKHGIKWLVFSSENEPYSIIRKIVEFKEGKPIRMLRGQAPTLHIAAALCFQEKSLKAMFRYVI